MNAKKLSLWNWLALVVMSRSNAYLEMGSRTLAFVANLAIASHPSTGCHIRTRRTRPDGEMHLDVANTTW
jgi:hypothetical protein